MELQVRGSPHVHSFIWILNPPKLSNETIGTFSKFIDQVIHVIILLQEADPSLYKLVKLYHFHKHSKCCGKYKNKLRRYGFGRFFKERTIASEPLENNIKDIERYSIIKKRDNKLSKVNAFINIFLVLSKGTLMRDLSIDNTFLEVKITKTDYYWTLSVSEDNDYIKIQYYEKHGKLTLIFSQCTITIKQFHI